jgi:hypothetical protein
MSAMRHWSIPLLACTIGWLAGCSKEGESEPYQAEVALPDPDLLGIARDEVVITVPWTAGPVSHDPGPGQVRATVEAVEQTTSGAFDRLQLEFASYSSLPGYRISWGEARDVPCGRSPSTTPGDQVLLMVVWPAVASDSARVASDAAPTGAAPSEGWLCAEQENLVRILAAGPPRQVRVHELKNPPRLVVDVQKPAGSDAAGPRDVPDSVAPVR